MTETKQELPAVARNINLPCKKCGVDRYFVVVAHTSETSAKVKCEVCGANKTYKLKAVKPKKPTTARKKPGTPKKDHAQEWNDLKAQIGTNNLVPYNMRGKFNVKQAIEHPKFGIGYVVLATTEKIDVAFQEGGRSLVHNRPA